MKTATRCELSVLNVYDMISQTAYVPRCWSPMSCSLSCHKLALIPCLVINIIKVWVLQYKVTFWNLKNGICIWQSENCCIWLSGNKIVRETNVFVCAKVYLTPPLIYSDHHISKWTQHLCYYWPKNKASNVTPLCMSNITAKIYPHWQHNNLNF